MNRAVEAEHAHRGRVRAGVLIGVGLPMLLMLAVAGAILLAWLPVRMEVQALRDAAQTEVDKLGSGQTMDSDMAVNRILRAAEKRGLPVRREHVSVRQEGTSWSVHLEYRATFHVLGITKGWDVDQHVESRKIRP